MNGCNQIHIVYLAVRGVMVVRYAFGNGLAWNWWVLSSIIADLMENLEKNDIRIEVQSCRESKSNPFSGFAMDQTDDFLFIYFYFSNIG